MESLHTYLSAATMLDALFPAQWVTAAGVALLLINMALSLVHTNQERTGKLWEYFGHVEGVKIPEPLGFLGFFLVLTGVLWIVGVGAFTNWLSSYHLPGIALIGGIIGARLSDSFYSHLLLNRRYDKYAANPGLASVPYYLVEAAVLFIVFLPGLLSGPAGVIGILAGWGVFALIRPALRVLAPASWRQDRWIPAG